MPGIFNESDLCYDADEARSGRKSFPSGHTSFAFAGATFSALLCFYFSRRISGGVRLHDTKGLKVPGSSLSLALLLMCYVPAFYVAISRTQVDTELNYLTLILFNIFRIIAIMEQM